MAKNYVEIIRPDSTIGIIDADLLDNGTRHPNLALMKISAYCKDQGCFVELLEDFSKIDDFEQVFVSRVFTFTKVPEWLEETDRVHLGGTGFFPDGGSALPYEIEHHKPDYDLYKEYVEKQIANGRKRSWFADYLDYSIGFTSRGCFRKCSFCVNKKYDKAHAHSPISEFLDESRPYIYLWDDNFFAFSGWESVLDELIATGKPFQFRQGLDVRLLNKKRARKLSKVSYCGDFIFAFDHIEDRELIEEKLDLWRQVTSRGTRLYVLCAYDSQDEKDIANTFERIKILMHYGCLPYIMRYESYKNSRWRSLYVNIARWCNQPRFFKKKSFRDFCYANQAYHKNKDTLCSALKSFLEFEEAFPEIAAKYFDLRYEEENLLYRFGRPFFGKPTIEVSEQQKNAWGGFAKGQDVQSALKAYYEKRLDIVWLQQNMPEQAQKYSARLFEMIRCTALESVVEAALSVSPDEYVTPENIPQFSNLKAIFEVPSTLCSVEEFLPYETLGLYLSGGEKKAPGANKKFGENHGKTASMLDIATVELSNNAGFAKTLFSDMFIDLSEQERRSMAAKLSLRVPIIRNIMASAMEQETHISDFMTALSESTIKRRLPNVEALIGLIADEADKKSALTKKLKNISR